MFFSSQLLHASPDFKPLLEKWASQNLSGNYKVGVWSLVCELEEDAVLAQMAFLR